MKATALMTAALCITLHAPARETEAERIAAYHARIDKALATHLADFTAAKEVRPLSTPAVVMLLMQNRDTQDIARCNARVLEMMATPGTGPFWMFPNVCIAYAGRDKLSPEARAAIREAWRTTRQQRGNTENHWVMYYASLYLMAQLYPNEPEETWYSGKNSEENFAEARGWLLHWMDTTTRLGQREYNPTHYIGEYAIPLLMLATWADDPEMRLRGRMMLDWLFAEFATVTLDGVLRGPNSRTDEGSVVERWNALASYFSWLLFGTTPPPPDYGWWGHFFSPLARNYLLPEVIYRIATDRSDPILQRDRAQPPPLRRYTGGKAPQPVYKVQYLVKDYAVGSRQGVIYHGIQGHAWDVTWAEADPRGRHNTLFSMHPYVSGRAMQADFATYPEPNIEDVTREGKPDYNSPDKVLATSPHEGVFQDLDTVIALYDIPEGIRFPHINGFFSKDLREVLEDASGWIFARAGSPGDRVYLAYRPLAPYYWMPYLHRAGAWAKERENLGGRLLTSPHLKNGTIVQAASASEFESFAAFQTAILSLPLRFTLEPTPSVEMKTLRGRHVLFAYGTAPVVDGVPVNYDEWKLFEGPHLNAEVGGRRLVITHGQLRRVLDFNTLTIEDSVQSRSDG